MLVDAQVSSMKISRSGSRSSWPSNQSQRRSAMSGRSCSLACAVFFVRDLVAPEEPPDRRHADLRPLRRECVAHLLQRQIGGLGDQRADEVMLRLDPLRARVPARPPGGPPCRSAFATDATGSHSPRSPRTGPPPFGTTVRRRSPPSAARANPSIRLVLSLPASSPTGIVNQKTSALGIPLRFSDLENRARNSPS